MQIAYLVHDVNDAAVARRVELFRHSGAQVAVAGFRRREHVPQSIAGAPVTDLGRTNDGHLATRAFSVLRHSLLTAQVRTVTQNADVIVARNLESLVLAGRVKGPGQRLIYECLDIHRLLLADAVASRVLLAIESWAMAQVDLVMVSSPWFRDGYFRQRRGYDAPVLLVENKVPAMTGDLPRMLSPAAGPPWVIGWFGMIRCRRSLQILSAIAAASDGRVRVVIAGRPSTMEFPDFGATVAAMFGIEYLGPYTPADLPRLFGGIHLIWAIDFFEEGLNSAWLLPNRLYEGLAHGTVPIALRSVATGDWLHRHDAGLLVEDAAAELPAILRDMDMHRYAMLRAHSTAVSRADVLMLDAEAQGIVAAIGGRD